LAERSRVVVYVFFAVVLCVRIVVACEGGYLTYNLAWQHGATYLELCSLLPISFLVLLEHYVNVKQIRFYPH
jgi:hypothetical protein